MNELVLPYRADALNGSSYGAIARYDLKGKAQHYLDASLSKNTTMNYASCLKHFFDWGGTLPSDPVTLIEYITALAEYYKFNTILLRVKAIRSWHKLNNMADPTLDAQFNQVLKGINNTNGLNLKRAKPFTKEDMQHIHKELSKRNRCIDIRNNALIHIGYFGAFRRSELVAIDFKHLTFSDKGVEIFVPKSKTDQSGVGAICAIPYFTSEYCPVKVLEKWLDFLKSHNIATGAVFRGFKYDLRTPDDTGLRPHAVTVIIKNIVKDYNLGNPKDYSGHSLRRGFATGATQAGATLPSIMKHGRWECADTVMRYIDEANKFICNPAGLIGA